MRVFLAPSGALVVSNSVRLSVPVISCLELLTLPSFSQVCLRPLSGLYQVCLRFVSGLFSSLSLLRRTDKALFSIFSEMLLHNPGLLRLKWKLITFENCPTCPNSCFQTLVIGLWAQKSVFSGTPFSLFLIMVWIKWKPCHLWSELCTCVCKNVQTVLFCFAFLKNILEGKIQFQRKQVKLINRCDEMRWIDKNNY